MSATWSAKGLLKPLWGRVGGRDALARRSGVPAPNLSGYNTGRLRMGLDAGRRIASVLDVTIYDLGAPTDAEAEGSPLMAELAEIRAALETMSTRREAFRAELARQLKSQTDLLATLTAAGVELRGLIGDLREAREATPRPSPKRRSA
jgi:hypothetical protein